jgi:hypothetical protein
LATIVQPAAERGRDFPTEQIKRQIPGRDAANHAERLTKRVIYRLPDCLVRFGRGVHCGGRVEFKVGNGARNINCFSQRNRLAVVNAFGSRKHIRIAFD